MAYTKYNASRVLLYTFGTYNNKIYGDYYYDSSRDGEKMRYRFKVVMTLVPGQYATCYYDNPVNADFVLNSTKVATKQIKGNTSGTSYSSEKSWTTETDWFDLEQTSGTVPASIKLYDTANSSWLKHTYNMNLSVIPATSELGSIADFDLERSFSVPFTKYSDSFTETLEIKYSGALIKSIKGYTSGSTINLSVSELLTAYKALGSINRAAFTVNLITKSGDTEIGTSTGYAIGNARGTTKTKTNGVWKSAIPFVKVNGVWKKAVAFTKVNGVWKRGNP